MNEHKLTSRDFERGSFHEKLSHQLHRSGIDKSGQARALGAVGAAIARAEQEHKLQFGVSGKHIDTAMNFLENDYEGRRDLKPKELDAIKTALHSHFGIEAEEN